MVLILGKLRIPPRIPLKPKKKKQQQQQPKQLPYDY
jgi:hypothetical protein